MMERDRVRKRSAVIAYSITALASLVLGTVYMLKNSFMPYHAEAVSKSWAEVETADQILISALMDVSGGGWFTVGVVIVILLVFPFRNDEQWAIYALPAIILIFYLPNLWATLSVLWNTPASPPWYGNLIACLSAVVGFVLYPKPLGNEA